MSIPADCSKIEASKGRSGHTAAWPATSQVHASMNTHVPVLHLLWFLVSEPSPFHTALFVPREQDSRSRSQKSTWCLWALQQLLGRWRSRGMVEGHSGWLYCCITSSCKSGRKAVPQSVAATLQATDPEAVGCLRDTRLGLCQC